MYLAMTLRGIDFAVADGRQQIVNPPVAVLTSDALERAVRVVEHSSSMLSWNRAGLFLKELAPDLD